RATLRSARVDALRPLAGFVFFANVVGYFVVPAITRASHNVSTTQGGSAAWAAVPLVFVAVAAGLLGAVLPLLAHFAIAPDDRAGQRLSYLYVANIIGSAAGSLITGFVFMDTLTTSQTSSLLVVVGFTVAAALYVASKPGKTDAAIAIAS